MIQGIVNEGSKINVFVPGSPFFIKNSFKILIFKRSVSVKPHAIKGCFQEECYELISKTAISSCQSVTTKLVPTSEKKVVGT